MTIASAVCSIVMQGAGLSYWDNMDMTTALAEVISAQRS